MLFQSIPMEKDPNLPIKIKKIIQETITIKIKSNKIHKILKIINKIIINQVTKIAKIVKNNKINLNN